MLILEKKTQLNIPAVRPKEVSYITLICRIIPLVESAAAQMTPTLAAALRRTVISILPCYHADAVRVTQICQQQTV